jgi:hypothetical protein
MNFAVETTNDSQYTLHGASLATLYIYPLLLPLAPILYTPFIVGLYYYICTYSFLPLIDNHR